MMLRIFSFFIPGILGAQTLQLAPPRIASEQVFFQKKAQVAMEFDLEGASIHYAWSAKPGPHSKVYTRPVVIKNSGYLSAISMHPDFSTSDVASVEFVEARHRPANLQVSKQPHGNYPGNGTEVLFNLKKGSGNLHDGQWLGFLGDTVGITADFRQKTNCNAVIISSLRDLGSWIMPMKAVTVWGMDKAGNWRKIGFWSSKDDIPTPGASQYSHFVRVALQPMPTRKIKIQLTPFGALPAGHPGAGTPAWLFLDEVVFQ